MTGIAALHPPLMGIAALHPPLMGIAALHPSYALMFAADWRLRGALLRWLDASCSECRSRGGSLPIAARIPQVR